MSESSTPQYPGAEAAASDLVLLANEYRRAASALYALGRKGEPLSRAPYRLLAIHALELYLSAVLIHRGHAPTAVRGLQHDLATRAHLAAIAGLVLRKRTAAHLASLAMSREYVVTRYSPEAQCSLSQVNRLAATLEEVAAKVTLIVTAKAK